MIPPQAPVGWDAAVGNNLSIRSNWTFVHNNRLSQTRAGPSRHGAAIDTRGTQKGQRFGWAHRGRVRPFSTGGAKNLQSNNSQGRMEKALQAGLCE